MPIRFREDSQKFDGTLGKVFKNIAEYQYACSEDNLTPTQRLSYFHHIFTGETKRFSKRHI